ncbi:MAG TPA: pyridoxal phosphate-dependent aminotransferase [Candidatus Atribacteria bacterium]|nr:pyridoxal phosphate-dependent aminotransferase [Candidatus Atribacteria bacterium]
MNLAIRMSKIQESMTLALSAKAKKMKREGIDVISLSAGEPDFATPDNIKNKAIEALSKNFTHYTVVSGIPELKEEIVKKFKRESGVSYTLDEVIVSTGAKQALYNAIFALIGPGNEVIIPTPYWVSYRDQVIMAEGTPVFLDTNEKDGFQFSVDDVVSKITPNTKAILLNSPNNPTGVIYDEEIIKDLIELALKHDFYIISDEIYEKISYEGINVKSIVSLNSEIKEKVVIINGFSKAYAMTGWRLGYAVGPKPIIKAMNKIQGQVTSCPNSITQWAGVEALSGPQDTVSSMRDEFEIRRNFVMERIDSIPNVSYVKPKGAFYIFLNISSYFGKRYKDYIIEDSLSMSEYLLNQVKIALVPGSAFGKEGYLRLSYATDRDTLSSALDRLEEGLSLLK